MNLFASELGAVFGILSKRFLKEEKLQPIFIMLHLCILVLGIQGVLQTKQMTLIILSIIIGGFIGNLLGFDEKFERVSAWLKVHIQVFNENFSQAITHIFIIQGLSLLAIVGPLQASLLGEGNILIVKGIIDGVSNILFAAIYGPGVLVAGILVLGVQLLIFFLGSILASFLTLEVMIEIMAVASFLLLALAIDRLEIAKVKVINFLPALLVVILLLAL